MIHKLINDKWVEFDGLKHVKKGDIFRCVDGAGVGPIMKARHAAKYVPSPVNPQRMVWQVKAPMIIHNFLKKQRTGL